MPITFIWETEERSWEALLGQLESQVNLEKAIQLWSDLEFRAEEHITYTNWRFHNHLTDLELKAAVDHYHQQVEPAINTFRSKIVEKLADLNMDSLDAELKKVLQGALRASQLRINSGEYLAQINALLDEQRIKTAAYQKQHSGDYISQKQLRSSDEQLRKAAFENNRALDNNLWDMQAGYFLSLVELRKQATQACGLQYFDQLVWEENKWTGFPYEHHPVVRDMVAQHVIPLVKQVFKHKADFLGKENLDPWDINYTAFASRFDGEMSHSEIDKQMQLVLERIHPECLTVWESMLAKNHVDIEKRDHKIGIAYTGILGASGEAVMIASLDRTTKSMLSLFHEFAHCYHVIKIPKHDKTYWNFSSDNKFTESFALFFEMISLDMLTELGCIKPSQKHDARLILVERMLNIISYHTFMDAFQEKVFRSDRVFTKEELQNISIELSDLYAPSLQGDNKHRGYWWLNANLLSYPYYNMEYVVAWIAAINLYELYQQDKIGTWNHIMRALAEGGKVNFAQAMNLCGIPWDFSTTQLNTSVQKVKNFVSSSLEPLQNISQGVSK